MSTVIEMPRYGANMDEGTIASWFVEEGESVTKGQAIAEIAIEKLSNELLAPEDGIILKLVGAEGETYDCGTPIAYIGQEGEDIDESLPSVDIKVTESEPVKSVAGSSDTETTMIVMPRYGANMEEGTVSTWYFSAGDMVEEGDVIAEISIEKLTNELLAPVAGPFYPLVDEGATVICGKTIAKIGEGEVADEGEVFSQCSPSEMEVVETTPKTKEPEIIEEVESNSCGCSVLTPKAQKLADELGVNATRIKGTGYHIW